MISVTQLGLVTTRHTSRLPCVTSKLASRPNKTTTDVSAASKVSAVKDPSALSTREIERDRGKPLSKYERNVMIFDWLHTLDESATVDFS